MSIREDATTLLLRLAQLQQTLPNLRNEYIEGPELDNLVQFGPERLSDAVAFLEENGHADVIKTFETAPYDFNAVLLTSRGRFEAERLIDAAKASADSPVEQAPSGTTSTGDNRAPATVTRFVQPVGSPFGFNTADWEAVSLDHDDAARLIVAFGHQWESTHFEFRSTPDCDRISVPTSVNGSPATDQTGCHARHPVHLPPATGSPVQSNCA